MTRALGRWVRAGAALALVVGIVLGTAGPVEARDQRAPDYTARLLDSDQDAALAELRGSVVLLNTWATWCEPCRKEMPAFEALYRRHQDDGLVVVGVNVDEGRADGAVSRYVERAGFTFPIWRDPANRFAKQFRVLGPPETFLIDRQGRMRFHWRGQMDPEAPANRSTILQALGAEAAEAGAAPSTLAVAGLLVAFGAGLISVLSPCVLPLVPGYASVIAGVSLRRSRRTAVRAGLSFVAGFSAVFVALGVLVNRAGAALADNRVWLSRFGGLVLVVLGLHLLGVLRVGAADREIRLLNLSGSRGYLGVSLVGVAFAAGWSPCVGPVLAGILTMAASGGSTLQAAALLGAYCAGLAVPFLAAALALDRFLAWSARLRRSWLPVAERVSGALVLIVGLLLLTGIFSQLASWVA